MFEIIPRKRDKNDVSHGIVTLSLGPENDIVFAKLEQELGPMALFGPENGEEVLIHRLVLESLVSTVGVVDSGWLELGVGRNRMDGQSLSGLSWMTVLS